MGTSAAAKFSESSVSESITNFKLRMTNRNFAFRCAVFLCALGAFAGNSPAQTEIDNLAATINRGSVEQKRTALVQIRNLQTAAASRVAVPALTDKSEIVRVTAPFSVVFLPPDEAAAALLPQLGDKSEFVRRETAYALGETRSVKAVQPLLEILQKDKQYSVRCSAAVALGEIGDISAVNNLLRILQAKPKEDEDFLRRSAARSIGQIAETTLMRDFFGQLTVKNFDLFAAENRRFLSEKYLPLRASVNLLIEVLQNPQESDDAKREAAFALGAIGDAAAIRVLQSKLAAEDNYLAEISKEALKKISIPANIKN